MLLTRRALILLLLTALLLALGTVEFVMVYVALAYFGLVAAMIVIDRSVTPKPDVFEVSRQNDSRLSLGANNRVIVRVTNAQPADNDRLCARRISLRISRRPCRDGCAHLE